MTAKLFDNTAFIMVRPEFLGNIGSVARVMKNFGFSDLRLVTPPKNYKDSEARMMAVDAFDLLKKAPVYSNLADAIADINMTVSTSSGRRRSRPLDNLSNIVSELVELGEKNRLAFVFGNERNGLLDDEISLCNKRIRIETSASFPSLNLAQSAGIIAYTMAAKAEAHLEQPSQVKHVPELPDSAELAELFNQLEVLLGSVEFSRTYNKRLILQELKDAFDRMTPTKREVSILKGVLFRLNHKLEFGENIPAKKQSKST